MSMIVRYLQFDRILEPILHNAVASASYLSYRKQTAFRKPLVEFHREISFDKSVKKIGGDNKWEFIRFVCGVLKWRSIEMAIAKKLLKDPWLKMDSSGEVDNK
ncbi:hypothetical protein K490DRAFT_61296 [Saccharata proteae CBS 121410]|uniref:Uncharacterized protein n=1 Tax=Saccharata proteae CBS 121410 TaxID=1314787 RepID=A0A9P4I1L4_9PEZI|nr:hypothetical protein K490DRAFT_61296 [Saccharata proteae CBS 121410]